MRQFLAPVTALVLLTGCASQDTVQRLRESEARAAMSEARLQCQVATNLPPNNKIVEECARGVAPDNYQRLVARDNAEQQSFAPNAQPVTPAPSIMAASPVVPTLPTVQPVEPTQSVPLMPSPYLNSGPSAAPARTLPFGNRTLVYGPNGGLNVYTPPPTPVPYYGAPTVQP